MKHCFVCTRHVYRFQKRLPKHLVIHTLPEWVVLDAPNLILCSQILKVSLRSCHWVKIESEWFTFSSFFFVCFSSFSVVN